MFMDVSGHEIILFLAKTKHLNHIFADRYVISCTAGEEPVQPVLVFTQTIKTFLQLLTGIKYDQ